ncbi:hypothetical protein DFA_07672 [Cavenderia fasciculata]|uniref:Uncharacterized protein n=1 Tax=Cavenderia fasciculata TaxID=261658 RepID=F4Q2R8_CACFS|nr:uncharacterized protein DFA_07672 [Cavenderia fasciculata]EGG16694.1 hypothetical protein DFA_07672 [Cavenderia fasciculata]|eukprot:XP_004355168.1 hypothetical protein DFA_07672 [Cavenderia fasciculata]
MCITITKEKEKDQFTKPITVFYFILDASPLQIHHYTITLKLLEVVNRLNYSLPIHSPISNGQQSSGGVSVSEVDQNGATAYANISGPFLIITEDFVNCIVYKHAIVPIYAGLQNVSLLPISSISLGLWRGMMPWTPRIELYDATTDTLAVDINGATLGSDAQPDSLSWLYSEIPFGEYYFKATWFQAYQVFFEPWLFHDSSTTNDWVNIGDVLYHHSEQMEEGQAYNFAYPTISGTRFEFDSYDPKSAPNPGIVPNHDISIIMLYYIEIPNHDISIIMLYYIESNK